MRVKRGTELRHGHGDPAWVQAPGPTAAGKGQWRREGLGCAAGAAEAASGAEIRRSAAPGWSRTESREEYWRREGGEPLYLQVGQGLRITR